MFRYILASQDLASLSILVQELRDAPGQLLHAVEQKTLLERKQDVVSDMNQEEMSEVHALDMFRACLQKAIQNDHMSNYLKKKSVQNKPIARIGGTIFLLGRFVSSKY